MSVIENGPLAFCDLVRAAGGAFPTDVKKVVATLVAKGRVQQNKGQYSVSAGVPWATDVAHLRISGIRVQDGRKQVGAQTETTGRVLADPHPADYDWRFTAPSLTSISELLAAQTSRGSRVALLGAPSLFICLAQREADVTLFDRSQSLIADLQKAGFKRNLWVHDMFQPFRHKLERFDLVFADPPWYPEFYKAFIVRASEMLTAQGLLMLSVLPWLTRPDATKDRAEILQFAKRTDLDLVQALPQFLKYKTPGFEQASLDRYGINCGDWRSGDLYIFRRLGQRRIIELDLSEQRDAEWDEFRFGNAKVKLRRRQDKITHQFAVRALGGNSPVLGTVSRRWPFRSAIDLWTSGNEAYAIQGIKALSTALRRLEKGENELRIADKVAQEFSLSAKDRLSLTVFLMELSTKVLQS